MLESYAVGVRVSLRDTVTGGLFLMSKAFARVHGDAAKLQKQLDSIQFRGIAGGAMFGAGALGLYILKPALEQAKLLQEAQARFATFGLGAAANADALRFAKGMNIYGSSYTDNLNRMIEAQGVFRESGALNIADQLKGAKLAAPLLAKIGFASAALGRDLPGGDDASAKAMLRFVEMRGGVNNAEAFNNIANLGFKAIQSSGGNVSWELYRQFMAHGATAAQGLSNMSLFGQFEPLIGELKGGAGTAWATAYNRLEGVTHPPNQIAHLLVDSGIWRKNVVEWNSMGGIARFRDNKSPLADHSSFESTPVLWYQNTVLPIYKKMGLDQAGVLRENAMIFGRTGGKMFNLIDRQLQAILRSVSSQSVAKDINQTYAMGKDTALGREIELRGKLRDIEASIGMAILPMYVSGLKALEPMLWAVSTWAKEHPGQLRAVILGWTALSAALMFGGSVLLLSSAFIGLKLALPLLRGELIGNTAAITGEAGLVGALGKARLGLLGVGLAAAGIYYLSTHPVKGTFAKGHEGDLRNWTPDWLKGSVWNKSINEISGADKLAAAIKSALHGVVVQLDGKPVGRIVSDHQGKAAQGPSTGPSRPDYRLGPLQPSHAG